MYDVDRPEVIDRTARLDAHATTVAHLGDNARLAAVKHNRFIPERTPEVAELALAGFPRQATRDINGGHASSFDSLRSLRTTLSKGPQPGMWARVEGSAAFRFHIARNRDAR